MDFRPRVRCQREHEPTRATIVSATRPVNEPQPTNPNGGRVFSSEDKNSRRYGMSFNPVRACIYPRPLRSERYDLRFKNSRITQPRTCAGFEPLFNSCRVWRFEAFVRFLRAFNDGPRRRRISSIRLANGICRVNIEIVETRHIESSFPP